MSNKLKQAKYWLRDLIWPRQKWLLRGVSRGYWDKVDLIPTVLFNCIIHFVEDEKCFETVDWNWNLAHRKVAKNIRECYKYAKEERPKLEAEISQIIQAPPLPFENDDLNKWLNDPRSYDEIYPNLTNLEKELKEKDSLYLKKIIEYREFLWT